jgi:dienelactone hydrolase/translation elongation factor EF-1beta
MFARRLIAAMLIAQFFAIAALPVSPDGPKDNIADNVRPVPPKGIDLPAKDAEDIAKGLTELQGLIKEIGKHELLPDVEIYEKAVRWAVDYKEIFDPKGGIAPVKNVLKTGLERARALKDGKTPWTTQTGLVVRGYRSKIDGSVQPYGLVIPKDYDFAGKKAHRLDFWWHGRGENLSEANFIQGRQTSVGDFAPPSTIVLHPYGRYCNANKFAGEIDTLECLDDVKKHYRIDENRLVARGFSMGGAACWQFAVHYPTLWCAANPGAGFSETPEFLNVFQSEKVDPPWYEKKLWHMYNASDYALNIFDLPTVAYSGEKDSQKQAADVMEREMKKVGLQLTHIIGPGAGHGWEKNAKEEVSRRIDAIAEKGRDPYPKEVKFVTYTTRYNKCAWIEIERLEKHWELGEVIGTFTDGKYDVKTKGVTSIKIQLYPEMKVTCIIDGQTLIENYQTGKEPARLDAEKVNGKWELPKPKAKNPEHLAKVPGLQGPIDDAFMDKFLFVKPTGQPMNEKVGAWVAKEMNHAQDHWRKQFRGDAPIKDDKDLVKEDFHSSNLILWGDPKSNLVLTVMAQYLPVKWTDKGVQVGEKLYEPGTNVPVLIYPNPLNPNKYIVINSGFTFREYDYLNNARQVPKLPDYAIVDITTPPSSRYPGKIVQAGFFGEKWELLPNDGK